MITDSSSANENMAAMIRERDWAPTPLGPRDRWPQSFKATIDLVLAHGFPMCVQWGPERISLYNDLYRPLLGARHPAALGRPFYEVWPEMRESHESRILPVLAGETLVLKDAYAIKGRGQLDEAWFDATISPLLDEAGDIGGVLITAFETTDRILAQRTLRDSEERQAFLLILSDRLRCAADPEAAMSAAAELFARRLGLAVAAYLIAQPDEESLDVAAGFSDGRLPDPTHPSDAVFGYDPDWVPQLRRDEAVFYDDDNRWPTVGAQVSRSPGVRSGSATPLIRDGQLVAVFSTADPEPRPWTEAEQALQREVAERTWVAVERLRAESALRESEERLRRFGEASQDVLWIRDAETLQWDYLTPGFEGVYGQVRDAALRGDNFAGWLDLIVPEDRDVARCNLARVRAGEWVTFEHRVRRPSDGEIRWLRDTDFPIKDALGHVVRIGGIGHDITDIKNAEEAVAVAELRQRALLEGMPQLVWRAVNAGEWTWASPQWTEFTGQAEADSHGWGWLDAVHPDDRDIARENWSTAKVDGGFEVDYRVRQVDATAYRWFHTRAAPVRDDSGAIVEWLGTSTDVDDLRSLQEQQTVLVAELQHRTRNLMGVIRSMADKTGRASLDLPDFLTRFRDRLAALARIQGLLSRLEEHDRVTFDELVETELAALGDHVERISLIGPRGVRLRSSMVQTLAMALHELATNAIKHGALGQPQGKLTIVWSLEPKGAGDQPWLHIDWRETGVSMPLVQNSSGQGREMIERALPYQLSAETRYAFGADGVHCTISVPVSTTVMSMDAG